MPSTKDPINCILNYNDINAEHKLHYDIYYNELTLYYQKTTIFMTVQLALFTGIILKYESLSKKPLVLLISLLFLLPFSILQFLIALRGYSVNNAVIASIQEFESKEGFSFLETFQSEVEKQKKVKKMNYPSYAIILTSSLFLIVWMFIFILFISQHWGKIMELMNNVRTFIGGLFVSCTPLKILFFSSGLGILLAISMKIADMLNEHGMKLFNYADLLFGIAWGTCGAFLVLLSTSLANAIMAMMIGYVTRKCLDYRNHIIAFIIIVFTFIIWGSIDKITLCIFSICFIILGKIKDRKYKHNSSRLHKIIKQVFRYVPIIYALPGFAYSMITHKWEVFFGLFCFDLTYNIVRLIAEKKTWFKDAGCEREGL